MGDRNTRICRYDDQQGNQDSKKRASHKDVVPFHDLLSGTAPDSSNSDRRYTTLSLAFQHRVDAESALGNCLRANADVRHLMDLLARIQAMRRALTLMNDVLKTTGRYARLGPSENLGAGRGCQVAGRGRQRL